MDDLTLARAQRGDRRAQTALINAYADPVHRAVFRILAGRSELVEDVTQEAFLKVIKGLPRFDVRGSATLKTWVLTIAARTAIDAGRRARRVPHHVGLADKTEKERMREVFRRLSAEKAGHAAAPPTLDGIGPVERLFRGLTNAGDALQGRLADRLGEETAQKIRDHNDGFGSRHRSTYGCPKP